jgi:Winged helix DNA-binding domain
VADQRVVLEGHVHGATPLRATRFPIEGGFTLSVTLRKIVSHGPDPATEAGSWLSCYVQLDTAAALALRMRSLLLRPDGPRRGGVAEVVTWFGAMQAQDVASGMWSLGVRLPGMTALDVHAALERREALRTWPMRGTVHLVPSQDAGWMLELMGARVLAGSGARRAMLGIDDGVAERTVELLGEALAGGGRLTRAQCLAVLTSQGISVDGQRGYHLLGYASLRGVTCIAPNLDGQQSFVLLDEWAPAAHRPERDEALATMAVRYFRSHGPTTRQDFAGWTGLTAADARRGIAVAADALATVTVEGRQMLLDPGLLEAPVGGGTDDVVALPGFDEYLLGYKDRSMMLDAEHKQAIIPGGNGVFQPTIVRSGRVIATWKRSATRSRAALQVRPLVALGAADRRRTEQALVPYASFIGRPLEVTWL